VPLARGGEFCIVDERTGKRRLTTYKVTRADAERALPGCRARPAESRDARAARSRRAAAEQPPGDGPG